MGSPRLTPEERAGIFKALSDPTRVDIVDALARGGSLCGTELAAALGISISLLSHHWDVLVDAGILKKERVGQLRVCTLDLDRVREATGAWTDARPRAKSTRGKSATAKRKAR